MAGLTPSETSVLVAGGGGVALKIARRLCNASCTVHVLQRSNLRSEEIESMGAKMVQSDVLEKDQVDGVFPSAVLMSYTRCSFVQVWAKWMW